ncbi:hypothetical protein Rifp1Sym_bf00220 [endosymbiont of Riftia pachyptila (vent Ph05)]|uniref:Uncharacterized protein n=1 Tax=endosymbiont of Riftia pachyptila (vent Ph05) TaxID=1048808 RepID=G2DCW3_9GAMM|nr:hypothetical protein Rifp1Sym_bf00220 [endosymbiont of Riftia pachyptila (vent Ph05)]
MSRLLSLMRSPWLKCPIGLAASAAPESADER